jgi:hypothetical protein
MEPLSGRDSTHDATGSAGLSAPPRRPLGVTIVAARLELMFAWNAAAVGLVRRLVVSKTEHLSEL